MTCILVIDDELPLLRTLSISLRAKGYEPEIAQSAEEGLIRAAEIRPDLVIVDLSLPGIDGVDVVRGLRAWSKAPVIVLTARHEETAKIEALDAGADDYITKPFAIGELLARIRAVLRRPPTSEETLRVEAADLVIDPSIKEALRNGKRITLTPKEWEFVTLLVRHAGGLVSQRQLLEQLWGPEFVTDSEYLRVLINRVRRKLEADPSHPVHFLTEHGLGYRFSP